MIFELFDLFDIFELFGLFEFWPLCSGFMFWTPSILNSLLSTGVIVLIWWIWFELIVSDNYVQLIGYNVVAAVKCEGSNLPLALGLSKWCPRLFRWCCLFMCIFKSMRYCHKCKIALIAIKLLFFRPFCYELVWSIFPICLPSSCPCWGWFYIYKYLSIWKNLEMLRIERGDRGVDTLQNI